MYPRTIYNTKQNCWLIKKPQNIRFWRRNRAAIVVTNQNDTLFNGLSDEDMVVLEVIIGNVKIILASMYLDINRELEIDLLKIEAILLHAKGAGVLIAADNSRSVSWHDTLTSRRGRIVEEFLLSKQIHILNESDYTTFQSRGARNIDITVVSNQLTLVEWEISE